MGFVLGPSGPVPANQDGYGALVRWLDAFALVDSVFWDRDRGAAMLWSTCEGIPR